MCEAQRSAAAKHDPDAMPLTPADFKRTKHTPQVKLIRCSLTQEEFAGHPRKIAPEKSKSNIFDWRPNNSRANKSAWF